MPTYHVSYGNDAIAASAARPAKKPSLKKQNSLQGSLGLTAIMGIKRLGILSYIGQHLFISIAMVVIIGI